MPTFGGKFDPKAITEATGNEGDLKSSNYFWDGIILYLGSVILALTGFNAVFEYVRGNGMKCLGPDRKDPGEFITAICTSSLPLTQYLPAFLYIQALAIVVPHFVFTATFGSQFDYFFSIAKCLKKGDNKFSPTNIEIVRRLRTSFTKYKRNSIYWYYILKLLIQLIATIGAFVLLLSYFTDYHIMFQCPRNIRLVNTTSFPLKHPVTCVFRSLTLLFYFKIVDLGLIVLIFVAIIRGFWFCASGHPKELQLKEVAKFAYQSGISHKLYEPPESWYLPGFLRRCYTHFPTQPRILASPKIATDFDFILLKLFRTNPGMGRLFKHILVELEMRNQMDYEKIAVKLYYAYRKDIKLDKQDFVESDSDLCWNEESLMQCSMEPSAPPSTVAIDGADSDSVAHYLTIPKQIRGAVLGLSELAPNKMSAITIMFGTAGYAEALERLFYKTASVVFTKGIGSKPTIEDIQISKENLRVDVTCPENAIVASLIHEETEKEGKGGQGKGCKSCELKKTELIDCLEPIWTDEVNGEEKLTKTSFIVIGPMNKKQSRKIALLLEELCSDDKEYLEDGCVIVTLCPRRISCRYTQEYFSSIRQPPSNCTDLLLDLNAIKVKRPLNWPPVSKRKEVSYPLELAQEALHSVDSEKAELLRSTAHSTSGIQRQRRRWTNLQCGDVSSDFEIHAYRFHR